MKQNTIVRHLFALLITFSFFLILLSFTGIIEANSQFNNQINNQPSAYNTYSLIKVLNTDKLLPVRNSVLIGKNNFKNRTHPKNFYYFLKSVSFLSLSANIFPVIFLISHQEICFCSKYIIRYIHNKDGPKLLSFVLL